MHRSAAKSEILRQLHAAKSAALASTEMEVCEFCGKIHAEADSCLVECTLEGDGTGGTYSFTVCLECCDSLGGFAGQPGYAFDEYSFIIGG